jgi:peroxiredoxin family protein
MSETGKKASIILFSGDMDKVFAAFTVASTAAASGMDTSIFCTFWGLNAIQKGGLTGKGFWARMLSIVNRGGLDKLGPSRLNLGGLGRWLFKRMMKEKGVASLHQLRQMCIDLDVKFYACLTSMGVMEVTEEDLIDEVSGVAGAATYVARAQQSDITLFI